MRRPFDSRQVYRVAVPTWTYQGDRRRYGAAQNHVSLASTRVAAVRCGSQGPMSIDAIIRKGATTESFDFGSTPCAIAPSLSQARVAIVTTAGLRPDGGTWRDGQGYVVLPAAERRLTLAHASSNFDRTGFATDLNVVYPADRLDEMAAAGRIGSVASQHLSFMGAQPDHVLETLRLDTGPAAAKLLRDDGVNVVFLTPV